jgi:peptide-methionine (R)-S-oxide reductase
MAIPETTELSDAEWRARLTPEQYRVLRRSGTEAPFTGQYVHVTATGVYRCAGCGAALFDAAAKYDSGTGWPSFFEPAGEAALARRRDWRMLVPRTEVRCAGCGGHLGHVFADGASPTGQRYCVNSCALRLDRSAASMRTGRDTV